MDLRAATASSHGRVDAAYSEFSLTDHAGYSAFLAAHHYVLPGCERALATLAAKDLLADWAQRVRTPALLLDMADVGVVAVDSMPSLIQPSPAEAFGMMYVLEGSRLGGAVLARRLTTNPDPRCRNATRYLLHGDGMRFWPSFVAALEASDTVQDNMDAVTAGAIATFALFETAAAYQRDAAR